MGVLEQLDARRDEKRNRIAELIESALTEKRDLSEQEDAEVGQLLIDVAKLDTRIGELRELEEREAKAAAGRKASEIRGTETVKVGSEPLTYTREAAAREGRSFFQDAYRAQFKSDFRAADRIARHQREMEVETAGSEEFRAVTTANFGGLIPPKYLIDLFAPLVYAGRPIANAVANLPLPDTGMSLAIPRGTTGTAVAAQTAENVELVMQDWDETTLNVPVITVGGQQEVSRQSLERGQGTDDIIFADLANNYAVAVDQEVISGDGAGGDSLGILNTAGINTVTYTDASPTLGELWPKLADAVARVQAGRYLPPTAILMHPRRWAFMSSALDSSGRPLINTATPSNAIGTGNALQYGQVVGTIQGLPVITDGNIPTNLGAGTNEDVIIVARLSDCLLFENNAVPRELRFEETKAGSLTVKLVVYGYMAFTAGRYPKGISVISGTGLVTPSF